VLAGDNAIVVGALAAGLPARHRKKVILIGVVAALVLRIIFALTVTQLLQIIGLILVGGLLAAVGRLEDVARPASRRGRKRRIAGNFEGDEHRACGRPRASPEPRGRLPSPTFR
jgi:predicted tellurium resistance membrane protein TerC